MSRIFPYKQPHVLYEDNHLLCVIKPPNIPVQADSSHDPDLLSVCKQYIKNARKKPGNVYLGLIHRLDRPVGGVMVFAKTSKAAARLTLDMQRNLWQKRYLAVVCGTGLQYADLVDYLYKDPYTHNTVLVKSNHSGAKQACLTYHTLESIKPLSLLVVQLKTGRHHQIRVQLSSRNLPIWGDARYNPNSRPGQQIALWAYRLEILHPISKTPIILKQLPPTTLPWLQFKSNLLLL